MNCLKIIKSKVLPSKVMASKTHVRGESSPKVSSLHPLAWRVVFFRFSEFPKPGRRDTDSHLSGMGGHGL